MSHTHLHPLPCCCHSLVSRGPTGFLVAKSVGPRETSYSRFLQWLVFRHIEEELRYQHCRLLSVFLAALHVLGTRKSSYSGHKDEREGDSMFAGAMLS